MGARSVIVVAETAKGVTHVIDTRAVGAYISQLRRDADLTQAEMASRLNLTHQAVSKWENGLALPDIQTLMDLADLFGVSIEQILSGGTRASHSRPDSIHRDPVETVAPMTPSVQQEPSSDQPPEEPFHTEPPRGSTPEQPDHSGAAEGETVELDIELLLQLAPFMRKETVNRAFEKACAGEIDPDCLIELAPFVSREMLDKAVHLVSEGKLSVQQLAGLAPFLSKETVNRAFERACAGEIEPDCLVELAPFVSRELVERAVDLIGEGKLSEEHLEDLAPFLGKNALQRALDKIKDGSISREALAGLAPFLGPDLIEEIVFGKAKPE